MNAASSVFVVAAVMLLHEGAFGRVLPRSVLHVDRLSAAHHVDGTGVTVATFDTGIATKHQDFRSAVRSCKGFTSQPTCEDGFGHGSFVAGTIASRGRECPGIAPGAAIRAYKVFTDGQLSYTSWFLDAVNDALPDDVDLANLSIGGPDYYDEPFMDKIREASAAGLTIVTAIGNDGPQFGTCYNPGDQHDVLAVGGHSEPAPRRIAAFSARGLTTWELTGGMGRPKPDVLTFGEALFGTNHRGGCKQLSGTSVAAPVVTGVLALVVARLKANHVRPNPALLKQILIETTVRLKSTCAPCPADMHPAHDPRRPVATSLADITPPLLTSTLHVDDSLETSITAQGAGTVDAEAAVARAAAITPDVVRGRVSLHPAGLDLRPPCAYYWPFCDVPLHHTSQPLVVNVTVLNGASVSSRLLDGRGAHIRTALAVQVSEGPPDLVTVQLAAEPFVWPWTGAGAIVIEVSRDVPAPTTITGTVNVTVEVFASVGPGEAEGRRDAYFVMVPWSFSVIVQPCPPRSRRVLWDTLHNLQYPPAFLPRDDLDDGFDSLDWHGDHPYLNYRHAFNVLRRAGYAVEIPMLPTRGLVSVDLTLYGAVLVVEPEDYYYVEELDALWAAVRGGTALVVVADWYDTSIMANIGFTDDNTGTYWSPVTGGANVPAVNLLLSPFGVEFSGTVWAGEFKSDAHGAKSKFKSGNSLLRIPAKSTWCGLSGLHDVAAQMEARHGRTLRDVPVLAASNPPGGEGRVVVFGDAGCIDGTHGVHGEYCLDLLLRMVGVATRAIDDAQRAFSVGTFTCRTPREAQDFSADVAAIPSIAIDDVRAWRGPIVNDSLISASRSLRHRLRFPAEGAVHLPTERRVDELGRGFAPAWARQLHRVQHFNATQAARGHPRAWAREPAAWRDADGTPLPGDAEVHTHRRSDAEIEPADNPARRKVPASVHFMPVAGFVVLAFLACAFQARRWLRRRQL
jgi:membrane-bound transcription factor site-1 protease